MSERMLLIDDLTPEQIASICDHTFLDRPEAFRHVAKPGQSPIRLHRDAFLSFLRKTVEGELTPYAVCVRPEAVETTNSYLHGSGKGDIVVASVVGFPCNSLYSTNFKVAETQLAIMAGAKEIDMIMPPGYYKPGSEYEYARQDISKVVDTAHQGGAIVKLILETSELKITDDYNEIAEACGLANECGVDFIKTSTGFSSYGARVEDLKIMREHFSGGIKISGGVNADNVRDLLNAASNYEDGYIVVDPKEIRIGESSLLGKL